MTKDILNDDLSDLIGSGTPTIGPRPLPTDPELVRVRETVPEFVTNCPKCGGSGFWRNRAGYPCFSCKGKGKLVHKTSPEARERSRQQAQHRKVKTAAENGNAFREAFPAEYAFLTGKLADPKCPDYYRNLLISIWQAVERYGDLSEGRLGVLRRGVAKQAEFAAARAAKAAATPPPAYYNNIRKAFDEVVQRGAKRAQITVGELNISLAPAHGTNAGSLYLKYAGDYIGKLVPTAAGTVLRVRAHAPADIADRLLKIEQDPVKAIKGDAEDRARRLAAGEVPSLPCGCCGITLTDPVSIARGIGPVCAGKWGF